MFKYTMCFKSQPREVLSFPLALLLYKYSVNTQVDPVFTQIFHFTFTKHQSL